MVSHEIADFCTMAVITDESKKKRKRVEPELIQPSQGCTMCGNLGYDCEACVARGKAIADSLIAEAKKPPPQPAGLRVIANAAMNIPAAQRRSSTSPVGVIRAPTPPAMARALTSPVNDDDTVKTANSSSSKKHGLDRCDNCQVYGHSTKECNESGVSTSWAIYKPNFERFWTVFI